MSGRISRSSLIGTFLNSAYITPSPRQAIAAGQAFIESKARPMLVGDLLGKTGEVRTQFARLINATPEEIGFVYATTEGENIVANTVPMAAGDNVVIDELCYEGAFVVVSRAGEAARSPAAGS